MLNPSTTNIVTNTLAGVNPSALGHPGAADKPTTATGQREREPGVDGGGIPVVGPGGGSALAPKSDDAQKARGNHSTGTLNPLPTAGKSPTPLPGAAAPLGSIGVAIDTVLTPKTGLPGELFDRDHIGNWTSLSSLLAPVHPYFADKQAEIMWLHPVAHGPDRTAIVYYADARGKPDANGKTAFASRHNPYRKYKGARAHAGRTARLALDFAESRGVLDDLRLAHLVFTAPGAMSKALASLSGPKLAGGREKLWRVVKKVIAGYWDEVDIGELDDKGRTVKTRVWRGLPAVLGLTEAQAARMASLGNLHVWATKDPLKSHYHVHVLILNVYADGDDPETAKFRRWFGAGPGLWKQYTNKAGKRGWGAVPLSDDELAWLKVDFTDLMLRMAKRNGLPTGGLTLGVEGTETEAEIEPKLSVVDSGFALASERHKFMHRVIYQKRSWMEDYVKYTEAHPDCANPPPWLDGYANRSRPLGLWCVLDAWLAPDVRKARKAEEEAAKRDMIGRVSEFTGEVTERLYPRAVWQVLGAAGDAGLGGFDLVKGQPVLSRLGEGEKRWLKAHTRDYPLSDEERAVLEDARTVQGAMT